VTLTFSADVDPEQVHLDVTSETGGSVIVGGPRVQGRTVVQPVTIVNSGGYRVGYHVVFEDGRAASGLSRFTVDGNEPVGPRPDGAAGQGPEQEQGHAHGPTDPLSLAIVLVDVVLIGVLLAVVCRRPRVRRAGALTRERRPSGGNDD
jgi:hypothetical protein